jgi:ribosomal protein L34E
MSEYIPTELKVIVKCSICNKLLKGVYLPELVEKYNWTGTSSKRDNKEYEFWYCPRHNIEQITKFEKEFIDTVDIFLSTNIRIIENRN